MQLSFPALLCNLTCSQFWPGLSSFVYHSPLLLLPVLSIHCHHLTRRTRSSRSSRCSSRGTCPDAAFALTTVVWTAAVVPSVWAEPAGGAPGECSLSSPQAHLSLSLLVLFFKTPSPFLSQVAKVSPLAAPLAVLLGVSPPQHPSQAQLSVVTQQQCSQRGFRRLPPLLPAG